MTSKDYELESELLLNYGLDIQAMAKHISTLDLKKLGEDINEYNEINALTFKRERDSILLWKLLIDNNFSDSVVEDLELHILNEAGHYHNGSSMVFDRNKKEAYLILENRTVVQLPSGVILE